MADAERITFVSSQQRGVGTHFHCLTKVGPIRLNDEMMITTWEPEVAMGVRHQGVVSGAGRFTLEPIDGGNRTRFAWTEQLQFPWWLAGPAGAWVSRPVLGRIWRGNLRRLAALVERG